jgi:CheY-like chemotaxis protein
LPHLAAGIEVYADPQIALEVIRANPRPAIVVTDFNMPGMSGLELLREIDEHHPGINGIISTGNRAEALYEASSVYCD